MTIKDLFIQIGTDNSVVMSRFGENELLLSRFIKKFPQDLSFYELKMAIESKDYNSIEQSAHTLKGLAANLGFSGLSSISADVVYAARENKDYLVEELFETLKKEYETIIEAIGQLD